MTGEGIVADEEFGDLEVISDGEGLVVMGDAQQVEKFMEVVNLPSTSLDLRKLLPSASVGAAAVNAAAEVAANAGRWMKLTEESARAAQALPLAKNSTTHFVHATNRAPNGQFAKNLQFVSKPGAMLAKPGAMLTNPAILAGVGGIMAQYAMQQTMEEITDYLAKIDAKVDDVLRAQKDAVFADMIGVEMLVDEAVVVRDAVGRVSELTWSKLQGSAATIARTQAYSLRQLDALAEKVEKTTKIADLADLAKQGQETVAEWLGVIARCFQLQEALGMLELDRVLDIAPDDVDEHRIALQTARHRRREVILQTTGMLLSRMDAGAARANAKVLLNPMSAKAVVNARNHVADGVGEFYMALGVADDQTLIEARRWSAAAADVRDGVIGAGAGGAQAVGRFGSNVIENARTSSGRLAGRLAERLQRDEGTAGDDSERSRQEEKES